MQINSNLLLPKNVINLHHSSLTGAVASPTLKNAHVKNQQTNIIGASRSPVVSSSSISTQGTAPPRGHTENNSATKTSHAFWNCSAFGENVQSKLEGDQSQMSRVWLLDVGLIRKLDLGNASYQVSGSGAVTEDRLKSQNRK